MTLQISGHNVDIGQSLRQRIDDTITDSVEKFFDGGYSGQITVSKSGREFHTECAIRLDTGMIFESGGRNSDPTQSFELAAERLEKRLRRYHRRLKDHKKVATARESARAAAFILEAPNEHEEIAEDYAPTIVAETTQPVNTLSVSHAVMELDRTEAAFLVFRNSSHGGVNVVFRRSDGNFGWIDPSLNETVSG